MSNYSSVTEILPGLWLGDMDIAYDDKFLVDKQIQLVVCCSDHLAFPNNSIIQTKLRIKLPEQYNVDDYGKIYQMIDEYCHRIRNDINMYNILIYCQNGHYSATIVVMMYIMKYGMMDVSTVIDCMETKRPGIHDLMSNHLSLLNNYQIQTGGDKVTPGEPRVSPFKK